MSSTDDRVFDEAQALANLGGNRGLLLKMAKFFLTYSEELLLPMRTAAQTAAWKRLRDANHKLMGSVCNFGKTRAYLATKQLEQVLDNGRFDAASAAVADVEDAIRRLNDIFRGLTGGMDLPT